MPNPGDAQYLGSILTNVHLWGIISDLDTPSMMSGSFEILGNDGAITLDALVGPQGLPGQNAPIVKMQYTSTIDDEADLPQNLTDEDIDVGKAWWIGNQVYVWDGIEYHAHAMGTQGPPGPVPNITPSFELLDPDDDDLENQIIVSGTALNPGWHFKMKAPRGPRGYNATIRSATDYNNSAPPGVGQVIGWDGTKFKPIDNNPLAPRFYSVPESAFTNFAGIATRAQIAAFPVPPQPWDWVPVVHGHIKATGAELDSDPFIIGCEIRLGHPTTGTLVARGFGNISTWTTMIPHFSTPTNPTDAVTPENNRARVVAGHTGNTGTLYVNLFNDGLAGAYLFNKKDAQLSIMLVPVGLVPEGGS